MIKLSNAKAINVFRDGIWQNQKMGYVYYNGEWVPLLEYRKWIYNRGEEIMPLEDNYKWNPGYEWSRQWATKEDNRIVFRGEIGLNEGTTLGVYLHTREKIDITEYSKILAEVDMDYSNRLPSLFDIGLSSEVDNRTSSSKAFVTHSRTEGEGENTIEVDIRDNIGEYYIRFGAAKSLNFSNPDKQSFESTLYNIWLE